MTNASSKTYTSLLTEGGASNGSSPVFEMVGVSAPSPNANFGVKVTLRTSDPRLAGHSEIAYGRNRKQAKHRASKLMLMYIVNECHDFTRWVNFGKSKEEALDYLQNLMPDINQQNVLNVGGDSSDGIDLNTNAVGQLQHFCTKYTMPSPIYKEISVIPAENNDFTFTIEVSVGTAKCQGQGRNKKTAKANAAADMFKFLLNVQKNMREEGMFASDTSNVADIVREELNNERLNALNNHGYSSGTNQLENGENNQEESQPIATESDDLIRLKAKINQLNLSMFDEPSEVDVDRLPYYNMLRDLCDLDPKFKNLDKDNDIYQLYSPNFQIDDIMGKAIMEHGGIHPFERLKNEPKPYACILRVCYSKKISTPFVVVQRGESYEKSLELACYEMLATIVLFENTVFSAEPRKSAGSKTG